LSSSLSGVEVEIGSCAVIVGATDLVIPHLTSGIALCLHDGGDVAGVAYTLRGHSSPEERAAVVRPALFVDLAVPALLQLMDERGARPERIAILVGGAVGPGWRRPGQLASETVAVARTVLRSVGIPIAHEVLGGSVGRRLFVDGTGRVRIDSARDHGRVLHFQPAAAPPFGSGGDR
jgi:chemotaxis receptor (MCP) glutamine deamidase CheD